MRSEGGVEGALCRKYCDPAFAIFFEVHDKIGSHNNSADAIAMGLWKSRGQTLEGFEIKDFRSDWLRELKNPAKAERISKYCDRWWLAVANDSVAKLEEVPPMWGLMVLKGKNLHVVKQAPQLEAEPISRQFLAALLRRGQEDVMQDSRVREAVNAAREESRKRAEDNARTDVTRAQQERDYFQKAIDEFEKASGIKISKYDAGHLGEAMAFLGQMNKSAREKESLLGRVEQLKTFLTGQLHEVTRAQEGLTKAFAALDVHEKRTDPAPVAAG